MKSVKKMICTVVFFAIAFQTDSLARMGGVSDVQIAQPTTTTNIDQVLTTERQKIEQLTIDTEKIKVAARMAINDVQNKLEKDEISQLEAAKIIGEQNYKIEQAEIQLAEFVKGSVEEVQEAEGYMSRLMAGVQDIGARILAPFKSGYGYTEKEKGIAQSIITELEKQLKEMKAEYEEKIKKAPSDKEKLALTNEYTKIEQEFNDEIYDQKLITGDEMSANRKLFWTAVVGAGAVMGAGVAQKYLGTEKPWIGIPEPDLLEGQTGGAIITGKDLKQMGRAAMSLPVSEYKTGGAVITGEDLKQAAGVPQNRELGEIKEYEMVITPQDVRQAKEALINAPQYREDEPFGGIETYGADKSGESYYERLKNWSPEEQEQFVSEVGENISEGIKSGVESAKAAGSRMLNAPQYRDEDAIALTTQEMQSREQEEEQLRQVGERAGQSINKTAQGISERAAKQMLRDNELYGSGEEESYVESLSKAAREAATNPQYTNPEEGGI